MKELRPKVATVVLIMKEGKVLLGRRKNIVAQGMYQVPGGHVEHLENLAESVAREIKEEVDIEVQNISFVGIVNVREFAPVHYVILVFRADWKSGEVRNCEPDKSDGWDWYPLDALPHPMTPGTEKGIRAFLEGKNYFE